MSVHHSVRDYFRHFITLHYIADDLDNKRSVSEITCGAEAEFGTAGGVNCQGLKSKEVCIQILKGVYSAFYSLLIGQSWLSILSI